MFGNGANDMGRRKFLKVASAAGVSAASLTWGTQEGLVAAADKDEVPYVELLASPEAAKNSSKQTDLNRTNSVAAENGRVAIYDSIPREEWERRWTAVNLRDKKGRELNREYDSDLISPAFTSMDSSPTGFGVKILYTEVVQDGDVVRSPNPSFSDVEDTFAGQGTGEAAKGDFYASREGIPIVVERREEEDVDCPEGDPMNQVTLDNVPGGVDMFCVDTNTWGSICAPFDHSDYGQGWIASGHVVGAGPFSDPTGNVVKQGPAGSNEKIGVVRVGQSSGDVDWCFIEDTQFAKWPRTEVGDPNDIAASGIPIGGIVTDDTLVNKEDTNYTLYTQGMATSRRSGSIINVGGIGTSFVTSENDVTGGDSGGTLFTIDGGYAYVAGVIKSEIHDEDGDGCKDHTKSTTATTVEEQVSGGSFMT